MTEPIRSVTIEERRARLGLRHGLADGAKAGSVEEASARMVGFHATDPASVYLSARARTENATIDQITSSLYDDRSLLRILGMRRTMFTAPIELARNIQAGAATRLLPRERKRTVGFLAESGVVDQPEEWLLQAEEATFDALLDLGSAFAQELTKRVPALSQQITVGAGTKWAGTMSLSTRVLFLLGLAGRIGRDRPRGTWTSSQHRWAPIDRWVPGGFIGIEPATGRKEIVRRWLFSFGPATLDDLRWWTGWTVAEIKHALADLEVSGVEIGGRPGLILTEDLDPVPSPKSWVAFLPGLDPTAMGWKERDWYLGPHRSAIFDRNGNIGPTIWHNGRIIGGWGQNQQRQVVFKLLEPVPAKVNAAVKKEAGSVTAWVGDAKVTPRFPTPLEVELAR